MAKENRQHNSTEWFKTAHCLNKLSFSIQTLTNTKPIFDNFTVQNVLTATADNTCNGTLLADSYKNECKQCKGNSKRLQHKRILEQK